MTDVAAYYNLFKDEQPTMSIQITMDIRVAKFLEIYDKENPSDKKLDGQAKKEQIADVFAEETDEKSAIIIQTAMDNKVAKFL